MRPVGPNAVGETKEPPCNEPRYVTSSVYVSVYVTKEHRNKKNMNETLAIVKRLEVESDI